MGWWGFMMNEFWIAGYPRSGNHRLRQVVYSLLFQKAMPFPEGYQELERAGYKKTHLKGDVLEGKAIYTIRDEKAVIGSFLWFFDKKCTTMKAAELAVLNGELWNDTLSKDWGSRKEHIKSFIGRPETLIVHYEAFGEAQVKKIADFLGFEYNSEVLNWCASARMKKIEEEFFKNHPESKIKRHIEP
jgi:hypothetical protein